MELFAEFIQERLYLKGISPKTVIGYQCALQAFAGATESKPAMMQRIMGLRERGISAISINSYLRPLKAYLRWMVEEGHLKDAPKVQFLKTELKVLATFTPDQIKRLLAFRPKRRNEVRAHTVALLILDGGYRISEVLGLLYEHCDFDNLVVKVRGKGNKHRVVPLSMEMRKVLYRYAIKHSARGRLLFGTRYDTQVTVRNFHRDFALMGARVGITGVRFSPHTLRHTFAVQYLRAGGNLFYLSKILGHTSVTTTQKYLQSNWTLTARGAGALRYNPLDDTR